MISWAVRPCDVSRLTVSCFATDSDTYLTEHVQMFSFVNCLIVLIGRKRAVFFIILSLFSTRAFNWWFYGKAHFKLTIYYVYY